MRIYLDNCCFNRPFDDQKQLRIRLETEAKLHVQQKISQKKIELVWSYILDFENEVNPFELRKIAIRRWKAHATIDISETKQVIETAKRFYRMGFKSKDSLHLACAIATDCKYFLTTDDQLIKKGAGLDEIEVTDPIDLVREECA